MIIHGLSPSLAGRIRKTIRNIEGFSALAIFLLPKCRLNSQLVKALDKAADVVTQHFAEHFVHLRDGHFRPDDFAKLRLDHREGRFRIEPLVVVL